MPEVRGVSLHLPCAGGRLCPPGWTMILNRRRRALGRRVWGRLQLDLLDALDRSFPSGLQREGLPVRRASSQGF